MYGETGLSRPMIGKKFNFLRDGLNISHWGLHTVFPLVARDIWDGSDEFHQCLRTVCENVSIPLESLCRPNGIRHKDKSQRWTCEFCWPNQAHNEPAIQNHCLKVGQRSALILHIAVGLSLGCITLSLLVWGLIMFCKNPRTVKKDQETPELEQSKEPKRLKSKISSKKRQRNQNSRVPIMPPARAVSQTQQPFNHVDGSTGDIELSLVPEVALNPERVATRAATSSIEWADDTVASRKSSASRDVAWTSDHEMGPEVDPKRPSRNTD